MKISKIIIQNLELSIFRPWPAQKKKFILYSPPSWKKKDFKFPCQKAPFHKRSHFIKYNYFYHCDYQELTEIKVNYFDKYKREKTGKASFKFNHIICLSTLPIKYIFLWNGIFLLNPLLPQSPLKHSKFPQVKSHSLFKVVLQSL